MAEPSFEAIPLDLATLSSFQFDRVLSESTLTGSIYLLGTLHSIPAIIHLQKTALPTESASELVKSGLESLDIFLENRPYFSAHSLLSRTTIKPLPDLTIKVIWPASETHIKKYTSQSRFIVTETPEIYERVVLPYIASFPADRLGWVYNILERRKEVERVLFNEEGEEGFIILPDLKWDQTSMSALYLTVLVNTHSIGSIRDLTTAHLPLLRKIRMQVHQTVLEKFGVEEGKLRMFVHYQPSYYHFHIHVVHLEHESLAGMTVAQAHLLEDIISLLELSSPPPEKSLLAKMTFTYALGVEHGLYAGLRAAQEDA